VVGSLAVAALFAALLPGGAAQATAGGAQQPSSEAALLGTSCRQIRDLSPWTYISGSCTRNTATPTAYGAWLRCWDVSAGVSYPAFGRVYNTPLFSYGPTSTARCDSGDYATDGGIRVNR
jgi:hypothetical protein